MTKNEQINTFGKSIMWRKISDKLSRNTKNIDLNNFRGPGGLNNSLTWDPYDKSTYRFYKNILYNLAMSMNDDFFDLYKKIGITNLGNPIEVIVRGCQINLDYVISVQEIIFCNEVLETVDRVVEIGAGFGRTCHAILQSFPRIQSYTIIDIPEVLQLSKKYLYQVLDMDVYKKISFLENGKSLNVGTGLYINIDSMQEMERGVVQNYLTLINEKGSHFYSRNPVCKFSPESIGMKIIDLQNYQNAISVGLCREVVDIFNSEDLENARKKYLQKYKPSSSWELVKHEVSLPWQYFHHALYTK